MAFIPFSAQKLQVILHWKRNNPQLDLATTAKSIVDGHSPRPPVRDDIEHCTLHAVANEYSMNANNQLLLLCSCYKI